MNPPPLSKGLGLYRGDRIDCCDKITRPHIGFESPGPLARPTQSDHSRMLRLEDVDMGHMTGVLPASNNDLESLD